jgi:hypothetical protein
VAKSTPPSEAACRASSKSSCCSWPSLPLSVRVPRDSSSAPPRDSSSARPSDRAGTRVLVAGGGGDYGVYEVLSDCTGYTTTYRTHVDHTNMGAQAEHESKRGYVFGVRGGVLNEKHG